ncbi:hypothetical protein JR316_0002521 [Psilocybe cubensis]|uniref:Uncharacterized protein n=2 Tax=Psilocybe cubensis TaxID=181762 RepID=A0A8H7Y560_PSICU|nr:hypothetical protein JR316_0002521 [Psilocybe cubensis]KAH9485611.1 hypothetical protein JR316_0002521 [Psilocybe cubensis]
MAHDFTLFDRPDLNLRTSARRRLPHPTSASATSSTLQNGVAHFSPEFVTYSEFLGILDDGQGPIANGVQPSSLLSFMAENLNPLNTYESDPFAAGPSRPRTHAYEIFPSPTPEYETGWIKDVFGKDQYVGHGRIEEVEDDDAEGNASIEEHNDIEAPRTRRLDTPLSFPFTNDVDRHAESDLPHNASPPPRPRPRKLPSLKATSDFQSVKAVSSAVPGMAPPVNSAPGLSTVLDDPTEVSLVKENINLLSLCAEDVKFMNTFFLAQSQDLSQHIDACSQIEEYLRSLRDTLTHRVQMGAEEWNVRSSSWHQKYSKRLLSLRTTLQRLTRVRQLIETQPLRPRQIQAILTKLKEHEAKIKDLASKYSVSFDRLRLRHLHFLLLQSHNESKAQKAQKTRLMSRASFERQWEASKAFRAGLRHAFNDLRQEFYNNPRAGRHTTAP